MPSKTIRGNGIQDVEEWSEPYSTGQPLYLKFLPKINAIKSCGTELSETVYNWATNASEPNNLLLFRSASNVVLICFTSFTIETQKARKQMPFN